MRFVVRPKSIFSTPKALGAALNARVRYYWNPDKPDQMYDFKRDFLFALVSQVHLRNAPPDYGNALTFYGQNKPYQRAYLSRQGLPVPRWAVSRLDAQGLVGQKFIVRPYRHEKGQHYRVTEDNQDFVEGREYISEVFAKTREYRIVFIYGRPVVFLRKKLEAELPPEAAWNHAQGSSFQTINNWADSPLSQTDCFKRLSELPAIKGSHIIGADVLLNKKTSEYVVCELNSCPSLKIEDNLLKIRDFIQEFRHD